MTGGPVSGRQIPSVSIRVQRFVDDLSALFPQPNGVVEYDWPPIQIRYLSQYLQHSACKTVVIESHYIDRDYIDDVALFYSKSLRGYPNYCQRFHFFDEQFDEPRWRGLVSEANGGKRSDASNFLQRSYLGFSVVRPLPGCPIGRTVLRTFGEQATEGLSRTFSTVRPYEVHLSGFDLLVEGLAFQQQDRGVSACATTALWCAIHKVAPMEGLKVVTPAEITQAASRYFMPGGRSLPSEGLTVEQLCEATRAAGLAPLYIPGSNLEVDRGQLLTYLRSGFAPVLALRPTDGEGHAVEGHAVCAVGFKLGAVDPQADGNLHFRDGATALKGLYIHDDRLGPYAAADILSVTERGKIRTHLRIRWPREPVEFEHSLLVAMVVPVPPKLRLSAARMRVLGFSVAEWAAVSFPEFERTITLNCRYQLASAYKGAAFGFGLTNDGVYELTSDLAFSRYIGLIEIGTPNGPFFDVVLDTTETTANPAVLACIRRKLVPADAETQFRKMAELLGAQAIW